MKVNFLYLGFFIAFTSFAQEEFHLSSHRHFLSELPSEVRAVTEKVNPQVHIVRKNKEFYGSYSVRTNTLSFNETVFQDEKKFKQTLFHELAHLYDHHGKSISQDQEFQTAFGGRIDAYNKLHLENLIPKRSPDYYEFENTKELFAVNFEYFMTDSGYKCRRPFQYNYFKRIFKSFDPSKNVECAIKYPFIKMEMGSADLIHVDLSNLYRIDYLLASASEKDISGGFGHSMLRLVMCAPTKKIKDEKCLQDLDYHLVVTFRASVDDEQTSSIKGLRGSYPSNLYIMPFKAVIEEYTKIQFRNLTLFPLKLAQEGMRNLIEQMSFQQWSLERRYYFVSNNCASEIVNLFRASLGLPGMFEAAPFKPQQLITWFEQMELIDLGKTETIRSAMEYWQKSLDIISPKKHIKFAEFLNYSYDRRVTIYARALTEMPSARTRALIRLIEFKIYSRLQQMYNSELEKLLREKGHDSSSLRELLSFRNAGWILDHAYGIPSEREQEQVEAYLTQRAGQLKEALEKLRQELNHLQVDKNEELLKLNEKIKLSQDYLRT